MKKSILQEIHKKALQLPVFQVRSKLPTKYSGEYLLSVNTFEVDGNPVEADKTYLVYPLHTVNHDVNLKSIYKKEGMEGVDEYCALIKDHFLQTA